IALLLLIPSFIGFMGTRGNYDVLSYLPENLESVQGETVLDETFNYAGMSMVIVEDMPTRYTLALKEEISEIDGVAAVMWADDITGEMPVEALPEMLRDAFFSADEKNTMMIVIYEEAGAADSTMKAIEQIKKLTKDKAFISGMSALVQDTKELTEQEAPLYVAVAVILALIVMSVLMESWILPLVILAALGMAIMYNMGTNIFIGEISFITQAIAAILQLGVTMDYSIFLVDRYTEEREKFDDRREAMANAVSQSFTALIGSSMTTVFGFVALCFMKLKLGFDIGFVMAKGVVLGILTVIFILPSMLLIFENLIEKYKHRSFIPSFVKLNRLIFKSRKVLAVLFVLLLIPAYIVQNNAEVYYNMDKALPEELTSVRGLTMLKDDFNMASTHFIIVDDTLPAGTLIKMEEEITKIDGVTDVLAYNTLIGPAIPDDIIPDELLSLCKRDGKQLIMVNSEYSASTDELGKQLDLLGTLVKSYDPNALITGEGALTKDLIATMDRDFVVTSILSIVAIFILIAICFKSVSLPFLLVLSIELAIWINLACATLMGTQISFVSPTIINCVQLGATVDYAILLTTRFREELRLGKDKKSAIIAAADATEHSILQSASVFFVATFGVYLISDILLIKGICALLARGAVISALVIIFFLTPMLYLGEKAIGKTTLGWRKNDIQKEVS
ncbi:MAG: RND family transporter, partial [Monoglobaceae bacterium]